MVRAHLMKASVKVIMKNDSIADCCQFYTRKDRIDANASVGVNDEFCLVCMVRTV